MERYTERVRGNIEVDGLESYSANGDSALEQFAEYEDTCLTPSDIHELRKRHCLLCGKYKQAHNGACNGCMWRKEDA